MKEEVMRLLGYKDWVGKYGYDLYFDYSSECELEDEWAEDEDIWLEKAYNDYISEYEDMAYEQYRDDKLFEED